MIWEDGFRNVETTMCSLDNYIGEGTIGLKYLVQG